MNFLFRRTFLASASLLPAAFAFSAEPKLRVGVIGHTGRGNYGHALDTVWLGIPETEIVAVADANPKGLSAAVKRLGNVKGYADYHEMLEQQKPDLVAVAPRWLDQHRDMVVAAAEAGARGIFLEKPTCRDLAEADEMVAACDKAGTKVVIAHKNRYAPDLPVIKKLVADGRIGKLLELRGRGKEDRRGGGEDLWVLGSHVLDLVNYFAGPPRWCRAEVMQAGRPITAADVKEGGEGIGPLSGDQVAAMYGHAGGVISYFNSVRNMGQKESRFALQLIGSKGAISVFCDRVPQGYLLEQPLNAPGDKPWQPITPDTVVPYSGWTERAARDLVRAMQTGTRPKCNLEDGRITVEMIAGVFESQRLGARVEIPLKSRRNPLSLML